MVQIIKDDEKVTRVLKRTFLFIIFCPLRGWSCTPLMDNIYCQFVSYSIVIQPISLSDISESIEQSVPYQHWSEQNIAKHSFLPIIIPEDYKHHVSLLAQHSVALGIVVI